MGGERREGRNLEKLFCNITYYFVINKAQRSAGSLRKSGNQEQNVPGGGGGSHMKVTGMLVGNFKLHP